MSTSSITSFLLIALVLYFALKLLRRRKKRVPPRRPRSEIERWIDDALARELQRKLGLERELIQRALEGAPEPEVVGAMEEVVRAMMVKYTWSPDGSVDVRLDISFEHDTSASASRVFPRSAMPADVKDEFQRTGADQVLRAVYFPWHTPE